MSDKYLLRVRVIGDEAALRAFLAKRPPGCERVQRSRGKSSIDVFLPADQLTPWRKQGLEVEVLFGAQTRMLRLAKQISRTDRFADGSLPQAYGLAKV